MFIENLGSGGTLASTEIYKFINYVCKNSCFTGYVGIDRILRGRAVAAFKLCQKT